MEHERLSRLRDLANNLDGKGAGISQAAANIRRLFDERTAVAEARSLEAEVQERLADDLQYLGKAPDAIGEVIEIIRAELRVEVRARKLRIVTYHGESETLWHIVDTNAAEDDQPEVVASFSSRNATRAEAERFLRRSDR
jgi:hypothetical protein